jgi:hypothetical protein
MITDGFTNKINIGKCFVWLANSFYKFISDYIINILIDIMKITDDIFFDDMITSVIWSVILFYIESVFKHQLNISPVIYDFLVVQLG